MRPWPRVWFLGGLEPSGRAGLLADVETGHHFGVTPLAIASCLTAQGEKTFSSVPVSLAVIRRQWRALSEGHDREVIKTGAIPTPDMFQFFARAQKREGFWWVIDPVVKTSRGQKLSSLQRGDFLKVAQGRVVLTPNLLELAWLCEEAVPTTDDAAASLGLRLTQKGFGAVVVKGGHAQSGSTDILCVGDTVHFLRQGARLARQPHHRGTGCRFASALAAGLAKELGLLESVKMAKAHVRAFLKQGKAR